MPSTKVETSIDMFLDEIRKKGKITVTEAAQMLDIAPEQAEKWAKLLEEHKDETGIEVHYPTFGQPEIIATQFQKSTEVQEKIQEIKVEKADLEEILETYAQKEKIPIKIAPQKAGGPKVGVLPSQVQKPPLTLPAQPINFKSDVDKLETLLGQAESIMNSLSTKIEEAKRTIVTEAALRALWQELKYLETAIQNIERATKTYDHDEVKQRLLESLQKALGVEGGKKGGSRK